MRVPNLTSAEKELSEKLEEWAYPGHWALGGGIQYVRTSAPVYLDWVCVGAIGLQILFPTLEAASFNPMSEYPFSARIPLMSEFRAQERITSHLPRWTGRGFMSRFPSSDLRSDSFLFHRAVQTEASAVGVDAPSDVCTQSLPSRGLMLIYFVA